MRRAIAVLGILALGACTGTSKDEPEPEAGDTIAAVPDDTAFVDETTLRGPKHAPARLFTVVDTTNPVEHGKLLAAQNCKMCHTGATRPLIDIKHFQFPDADITRRALFHNDATAAAKIVAYVHTLTGADTLTPDRIPFQPHNTVLASDAAFGVRLFGVDQWPANMTRDSLLKHNPANIAVALRLPPWSDEASFYDWLAGVPQDPLPPGVRGAPGVQNALNQYEAAPTVARALVAAKRVMNEAHNLAIPDAPCRYPKDNAHFDAQKCTDIGRWISTFLYVACLETGDLHGCMPSIAGMLWEVGHLFHKAQQHRKPLPQRDLQIAGWMHISFLTDRNLNKQSSYETGALQTLGFPRMATWVALRTQVERPAGTILMCADAYTAALDGGPQWALNALTDGYTELQWRAANGQLPSNRAACADYVRRAQIEVGRYAPAVKTALQPLADQTMAKIMGSTALRASPYDNVSHVFHGASRTVLVYPPRGRNR
jgi:hypothetical protein